MKFLYPSVRLTSQKPRSFVSVRQTNQIALFRFVCCFCFVRAFSFQGHTKIALSGVVWPATARDWSKLFTLIESRAVATKARGFSALNSQSSLLIINFTSVSVGSSPRSYLFTSAAFRITVHSPFKCGTEPVRYRTLHFRDRCVAASLRRRK